MTMRRPFLKTVMGRMVSIRMNFGPGPPQKKVGGQDAGDHQGHGGADAAALLGHLDGDLAHLEDEPLLIVGGAEQAEDQGRGPGGPHLKQHR